MGRSVRGGGMSEMLVAPGLVAFLRAGCRTCLAGRNPVSEEDWCELLNYAALNLEEPRETVLQIMHAIVRYSGCAWSADYVEKVLEFQEGERRQLGLLTRTGDLLEAPNAR